MGKNVQFRKQNLHDCCKSRDGGLAGHAIEFLNKIVLRDGRIWSWGGTVIWIPASLRGMGSLQWGLCLISLDARFPSHLLLGAGASHSLHLMQLLDVNFPNFRITMPK